MKVTLTHRRHGLHTPVKDAEIPGVFTDYATATEQQPDTYRIEEGKLLAALPPAFLPVPTETVLLMVDEGPWSAGQTGLSRFCNWAKYFDAYVLNLVKEEPGPFVAEETPAPSDILRRAAAKLRDTAAKATPGPWENCSTHDDGIRPLWLLGAPEDPDDGWTRREVVTFTEEMTEAIADITEPEGIVTRADLDWIALASPVIAAPLATWLESVAAFWPKGVLAFTATAAVMRERSHALLIARALLGETGD